MRLSRPFWTCAGVALLAVAGIYWWTARESATEDGSAATPADDLDRTAASTSVDGLRTPELPEALERAAVAAELDPLPLASAEPQEHSPYARIVRWRLGEEPPVELEPWRLETRQPTPSSEFELLYAGRSTAALSERMETLAASWNQLAGTELRARLDGGEFIWREQDMELDMDNDGRADEQLGFTFTQRADYPRILSRTLDAASDRPGASQVTWLPFNEYPDYYRSQDEVRWLREELRRRASLAAGAGTGH
jgi:hypothetical protein